MKRSWVLIAGLALIASATGARAGGIGIGAYAGTSIPVLQDDNANGPIWGLRVPVHFTPIVTVEPYFAKTSGGDRDQEAAGVTYTRTGMDVTSYGANVLLNFGTGFQMSPFFGIGSNKLERPGLNETQGGWDAGLGLGFGLPLTGLSGNVRGALNVVKDPASDSVSRKWAELTVGVSYSSFHFPPAP